MRAASSPAESTTKPSTSAARPLIQRTCRSIGSASAGLPTSDSMYALRQAIEPCRQLGRVAGTALSRAIDSSAPHMTATASAPMSRGAVAGEPSSRLR